MIDLMFSSFKYHTHCACYRTEHACVGYICRHHSSDAYTSIYPSGIRSWIWTPHKVDKGKSSPHLYCCNILSARLLWAGRAPPSGPLSRKWSTCLACRRDRSNPQNPDWRTIPWSYTGRIATLQLSKMKNKNKDQSQWVVTQHFPAPGKSPAGTKTQNEAPKRNETRETHYSY